MGENDTKRLDNTIKAVYEVLEKNKENPKVKEAYEEAEKLMEKRKLK